MNADTPASDVQALEDIERAAWLARLAFGDASASAVMEPIHKTVLSADFVVMP